MQEEISFGVWLRKQRRGLDLTRQAFADQVGCAEVTLRRIEAGTLKPSKELAQILLEKLGIPTIEWPQWIAFARGLSGFPSPSAPSLNKPNTNIPAPITTFIGREREQSEVIRLIAKHRLVTLTGSGGVGKTRLSLRVGEQVLGNYADGVWLVELAPILDPLLVPRTTAIAIGLRDELQRPIIDMLSDYLREKKILIILDNCEHLLDASAQLADTLLKRCPSLKILTTSREALGILGEAVYLVPSLALPDMQQLVEKFRDYESVCLFEERAQLARMDFSLTVKNALSVAKICSRLDGIPLAIELAAARVSTFSTKQIEQRLQESFSLLATGNRTALPRHQTLRAAIDWSYNLLSDAEQALFQRLSVFVGGWTLEAAEYVCEGGVVESDDVFNLLEQLIKKSLVNKEEKGNESRYRMLETIRQYAHEKLLEVEESNALRDKHLAYFVKLVEQAEPELYRSNQVFWFNKLDAELDNLRMTLEWALATDVESGLRITSVPWRFWQRRNYLLQEVRDWLSQLLERYPKSDSLRAQALAVYSRYIFRYGNFPEARKIVEQGLELARVLSDRQNEALSLLFLGRIMYSVDLYESIPLWEQSLAIYRTLGDKIGQATATGWLGTDYNLEHSKTLLLESLQLHRDLGNLSGIAECLDALAQQAMWRGDFSSPLPWLEEARMLYREIGEQAGEWNILINLGRLAYWQNDYQQACAYYEQAITLDEKVGDPWSYWLRIHLAYAMLRQGDIAQAKETFEIGIQQFQKVNDVRALIYAMEGLASLYVNQNQFERAARLFAWADTMREKIGDRRPKLEQVDLDKVTAACIAKMGKAAFSDTYEEGKNLTLDEIVEYVLKI